MAHRARCTVRRGPALRQVVMKVPVAGAAPPRVYAPARQTTTIAVATSRSKVAGSSIFHDSARI